MLLRFETCDVRRWGHVSSKVVFELLYDLSDVYSYRSGTFVETTTKTSHAS